MSIFGDTSSPFDECIEKVTAANLITENWAMILDVCDKINSDPRSSKNALLSIRKRLNHRDPHVVLLALSVLDSCWSNCGPPFRKEVSSANFINELQSKAVHSTRLISEKTRMMIQKWVENECKTDSSLSLVTTLYKNLLADGYSFTPSEPKKSDNSREAQAEEEEALVKAIALSLQDAEAPKTNKLYQLLESAQSLSLNGTDHKTTERTVRALYDFEAAEDNELSFVSGDLITVIDDSNPNWWCGRIGVQQGLFPSSFVTSDLSEVKKETVATTVKAASPVPIIDESILLRCIQMLEDCDPTGETPDPPELASIEQASRAQGPLINARLAAIDTQINALSEVDMAIRDVLALYDQAVQQAHYQATMYQNASATNPSAINMSVQPSGIPQNTAVNFPPSSSQVQHVFQTSCTEPQVQTACATNVQASQDAPTNYVHYAPIQQTTYQQQTQVQPQWNAVQHHAQNY
ncbi:VHS domain protein [Dictyocaulus viviparus]|uniref:VHS domain protein n=1 Tax=Dictyocaulus viviparus TaxID=29172 RepID=A0A0D8XQC3_DICVI|nr:VHS domain protein [Dictyocaulus viviparus]